MRQMGGGIPGQVHLKNVFQCSKRNVVAGKVVRVGKVKIMAV